LFVTLPPVRSKQLECPFHWIVVPEIVHCWFAFPDPHVQICSFVPSAVDPPETSKHLLPKIWIAPEPETVDQLCDVEPAVMQSSISTTAPSALDAAVRHLPELALGWMYWFGVGVGVAVGPEGAVVVEKTGVPVWHAIEPPQAAPGSGLPLHVQDDYRND
jgi:hypothetical protein